MSARRLRSVLALLAFVAALAKLVQALRGEQTATFTDHPSVDPRPAGLPVDATAPPPARPGPEPAPAAPVEVAPTWVAPDEGACPDGYPVKAKLKSGIFHLPGMSAYDRTTPDRCYPTAEAAAADGLRAAKR